MKIELELSEDCECTESPWWMIVDPKQNFSKGSDGVANIAMGMIEGPFFSRQEAEEELNSRRYAYGRGACVWCASGYRSRQYMEAIKKAKKEAEIIKLSDEKTLDTRHFNRRNRENWA